jgi:hypothetical protein
MKTINWVQKIKLVGKKFVLFTKLISAIKEINAHTYMLSKHNKHNKKIKKINKINKNCVSSI